jgi:hypothetical protein
LHSGTREAGIFGQVQDGKQCSFLVSVCAASAVYPEAHEPSKLLHQRMLCTHECRSSVLSGGKNE